MGREDSYDYEMRLTLKQMRLIKDACEEYFRLRLNQWTEFTNDVALDDFDYRNDDPNHSEKFDAFIKRRDSAYEIFMLAMRTASPHRSTLPKSEQMLILEDIWEAIRFRLGKDIDSGRGLWTSSRMPLHLADEPFPIIKRLEGGSDGR